MRTVSIIGAGQAGLTFAHALLRHGGYSVTLYSDRTAGQWLDHSAPTGTAFLYGPVIQIERDLGIDRWTDTMFGGAGVLLDFCPRVGVEPITIAGSFGSVGGAVDQRMKIHAWMRFFEERGGKLVIEAVTPARVEEIAAQSDVTLLAAGKGEISRLIPRDPERSVYDQPQRNLAMVICTGVTGWSDRVDFVPVKFSFFGDAGEFFWVPYTHKSAGPTWCVLFEAKPGGAMDRFGDCRSGDEVNEIGLGVIREFTPWDLPRCQNMRCVSGDDYAWLKGRFPPTVRKAFGRLPNGRLIMPLGDTAITFDPIGGQGGNCASRNALFTANQIIERGDRPFDAGWMQQVNQEFWNAHGKAAYTFNNILLEPLDEAGAIALQTCAASRRFADEYFFGSFPRPQGFFPWIQDPVAARQLMARYT